MIIQKNYFITYSYINELGHEQAASIRAKDEESLIIAFIKLIHDQKISLWDVSLGLEDYQIFEEYKAQNVEYFKELRKKYNI